MGCGQPATDGGDNVATQNAAASQVVATDEIARGREQLIRAFDAAWVRYIRSGKYDEALAAEPPNQPGLAASYAVRLVDCLPLPELIEFPAEPVGLLKRILETGKLRQITQGVPNTPGDTSYYFSGISSRHFEGVVDEIEAHYGVELTIEDVVFPPGRLPATSALLNDEADYISQLNATGGVSQGLRRRTSRRFTCTMSASSQFIQIPETSELAESINSWSDLAARPDVRICSGPLSTQTVRAFLPNHTVKTVYIRDLATCVERVANGESDILVNPLPDLSIAGVEGYKSVHTNIVAGTPLWVALEGIECPSDDDPDNEDVCFEVNPP